MDTIIVTGGGPVRGQVSIAGAKNACLALMPAALLSEEPLILTNAPRLRDIETAKALLSSLGADVDMRDEGREITICAKGRIEHFADDNIMRRMRASNLVLGPLLARTGRAVVALPGGCAIGERPMEMHLDGLEKMGAKIERKDEYLHAEAPVGGLRAAVIELPFPSVGATENLLMAATLAKGTTVIENAAREPEVTDLAECLRQMGAHIEGEGSSRLRIEGVDRLRGAQHRVIFDRIELGTYMISPAIAGGEVECIGGHLGILASFAETLAQTGLTIEETSNSVLVRRDVERLKAVSVTTEPYPGFPTDLQAQMMTLLCTAQGQSVLQEDIFENRFMHALELNRMGAQVDLKGRTARITGVKQLTGASVKATDLRASVSLILAGLAAKGETRISDVYHVDRGYEQIVRKFRGIGANIERVKEE